MSKNVLLVGNGAREHVMGETIKRSPQNPKLCVFAAIHNPGLMKLADAYRVAPLSDFEALKAFVEEEGIELAAIGPENPLGEGIADFLLSLGVKVAAPIKSLARLETAKSFTRDLLAKYDIPGNPLFRVFSDSEGMLEFMRDDLNGEFVVKAEGLHGGKGVKVMGDHFNSIEEGLAFAEECIQEEGKVVVEEKLYGQEFSLMSFVDGKTVVDMPAAQDHKRAFENDEGPNTGGMGTYSDANHSLPFLTEEDLKKAHEITVQVMQALEKDHDALYKGVMYGGFIATAKGVSLIEYNARFGDPEAMNVLPLLKTDFVSVLEAICDGTLDQLPVEFADQATVCKYVVPQGYPDNPVRNEKVSVGEIPAGVKVYYASVDKRDDGIYLSGSRAIAMVGIADTIAEAEKLAQKAVESVSGPVFYRKDIGTDELIGRRVQHMRSVRG
ncbi:MAG: phosphoribosylamine--glycine ligase [Candidatus Gracilibacteria bacterium]|nr:phosphoribosylamine--glycine ligase [Candidatus Gracilibacteria bacterium]